MITTTATNYASDLSATRRLESERHDLKDRIQRLNIELFQMEKSMNIHNCWELGDHQYQQAVKYIATRHYQQALGRLQCLVIQRLFELQKMNLSHTGQSDNCFLLGSLLTTTISLSHSHAYREEPPEMVQGNLRSCQVIQCRSARANPTPSHPRLVVHLTLQLFRGVYPS